VQAIQSSKILGLIQSDNEQVRNALFAMSATLIATQPKNSKISGLYEMAINFIDVTLGNRRMDIEAFKLWYFISKDYTPMQGLDQQMRGLFQKYNFFQSQEEIRELDIEQMMMIYGIVDEYILLGFIPENNFADIIAFTQKNYLAILQQEQGQDRAKKSR
jgi:hypothetical protein